MKSSLFAAMAAALVERPEEVQGAENVPDNRDMVPTQRNRRRIPDVQHGSLVAADPDAFYAEAAFFSNSPPPIRVEVCTASRCRWL